MGILVLCFLFLISLSVAQECSPTSVYDCPPKGCPYEMLECGHGRFNASQCVQWYAPTVWNAAMPCTCDPGWIGTDCSMPDTPFSCNGADVYDGVFLNANAPHKHIECFLDFAWQGYLDLEDHRVNISIDLVNNTTPGSVNKFNISFSVMSRIHFHTHEPNPWGPVIPAMWCELSGCTGQSSPDSSVMYSCPEISCGACTPEKDNCNEILDDAMKDIWASVEHPSAAQLSSKGTLVVMTNIVRLTGKCIVGQCNPFPTSSVLDNQNVENNTSYEWVMPVSVGLGVLLCLALSCFAFRAIRTRKSKEDVSEFIRESTNAPLLNDGSIQSTSDAGSTEGTSRVAD